MKIVLTVATKLETEPLLSAFSDNNEAKKFQTSTHEIDILITGVGMVATAFALGNHLAINKYDLAINAGIAGSFDFNIALGDTVLVTEDVFAEQGAEDGDDFLSIDEMGFGESRQFPSDFEMNNSALQHFKKVKAITVNKVHGHELSIAKVIARVNPQIESMEGAAFFYACNKSNTPCIQIRTISNYVERRNREKWNIGLAIKNLNAELINLFENLPDNHNKGI